MVQKPQKFTENGSKGKHVRSKNVNSRRKCGDKSS